VTDVIKPRSRTTMLWIVGWLSFFMGAVLDNLTTTIVMVSLLHKLCPDDGA
jgi:Na+/H+ antiporter NhaD/arsenite permease-like protein